MGIEAPQAEAISNGVSLKQLGIWLNQNKQKNVDSVETTGSPVAVKAGFFDLLISFATQFGLGALHIGSGLGEDLQKQVSQSFGDFGTWLDNSTSGAFASVRDAVTNVWSNITVASTPVTDVAAAAEQTEADLAARLEPSLGQQFTDYVKPKIDALTKFANDLYKKDLVPGETNFSMEDAFNTVSKKFNDASKALGIPEISLNATISSVTDKAGLAVINTKMQELSDMANTPGSTTEQVQAKLTEVQSLVDAKHGEMLDNQQAMTDAKARQAVLDEVDNIYSHILSANTQIAEYQTAGNTVEAENTQLWLDTYRSGIAPQILTFVDSMIEIDAQRFNTNVTPVTTTMPLNAENKPQVIGSLPVVA
jgi:hypothetical protein